MHRDQTHDSLKELSATTTTPSREVVDDSKNKKPKTDSGDRTQLKEQSGLLGTKTVVKWKQRCIDTDMLDQIQPETEHLSFNRCWQGNQLQKSSLYLFQQLMPTQNIKILWMNYCCLTDSHMENISPLLLQVQQICFSRNNITDRGARVLAKHLKGVELLNLSCNQISGDGATLIVVGLLQLKKLYLDGNGISPISKMNIGVLAPCHMSIGF